MNIISTSILVVFIFTYSSTLASLPNRIIKNGNSFYLSNTVIVKLKNNVSFRLDKPVSFPSTLKKKFEIFGVSSIIQTFKVKSKQTSIKNILTLNYTSKADPLIIASKISRLPEVLWAEPHYVYQVEEVPNDPSYAQQHYLNQIQASQAWDINKGDSTVIIGIVDTGIDWDHPDLTANMWLNKNEIPDNGVDDDNNGYIDDYRGWDFGGFSGISDNDPNEDRPDHGTHVAGIASSVTNNGIGIAGIGYRCKLMPVKVSIDDYRDIFGNPYIPLGYQGIIYAAENGAKVINCSWGSLGGYSRSGQEIIQYANSLGALIIAAAGNDDSSDEHFPSGYPGVLSVASVNQSDKKSSFSNYGAGVDVCAPGESIYSTWQDNTYRNLSGTSMSSPLVSGLAGLVYSLFPSYTPLQIAEQIRVNSDAIDDLNSFYLKELGFGRINALKALSNNNSKSIRAADITFTDQIDGDGDGLFEPGEVISITVKFVNYLQPVNSLNIKLENNDIYSVVNNPDFSAGSVSTLDSVFNTFKVTINSNVPSNWKLELLLNYTDENYSDFQLINTTVNPSFLTQNAGNVDLTITSKGTLGFNDYPANRQGEGFVFRHGKNLLFEGALMIGVSPLKVSDAARSEDQSVQSNDFQVIQPFNLKVPGTKADQQGLTIFNDNAAENKIGIETELNTYAFADVPYDNFIILEYKLINKSGASLSALYTGLFFDWDLFDGTDDFAGYNTDNNFGYVYHTGTDTLPYAGAALISHDNYHYYAILNPGEDNGFGIYDAFTDAERFQAMSKGISKSTAGPGDVSFVVGSGSYSLNAGDTIVVAFAVAAGDNAEELKNSIIAGRSKYQSILTSVKENNLIPAEYSLEQNYPNPFNPLTNIELSIPEAGTYNIEIYNVIGEVVKFIHLGELRAGTYKVNYEADNLTSGVYIYRLKGNGISLSRKMIFAK